MYQTFDGIVLRHTKYGDNKLIVNVYTRQLGLRSFLVHVSRNKKSGVRSNLFQPLSGISFVGSVKENRSLGSVKEIQARHVFNSLKFDLFKSSIVIFINEVLLKSIQEEETNEGLFDFIDNSLKILDAKEDDYANFHLLFLLKLTRYLGFWPSGDFSKETPYFDLMAGEYVSIKPLHDQVLEPEIARLFHELTITTYEALKNSTVNGSLRKMLLGGLLDYYRFHIASFNEIRSLSILSEVMASS